MSDETNTLAPEDEESTAGSTERLLHLRDGRHVLLRPAGPDDAHLLLRALNEVANEGRFLLRRAWNLTPELEQRWLRVALGGVDLLVVAVLLESAEMRYEQEIAGSLSLVRGRPDFIRHTAELSLWLRPAYREQGLGSAMIEYGLGWAAMQGNLEKLTLSVRSSNRRAVNLYSKYGFQEEGCRRGYIKTDQGYEDELLLSRFIAGPFLADRAANPGAGGNTADPGTGGNTAGPGTGLPEEDGEEG